MRVLLIVVYFATVIFAQTIDCTKVFEERKAELLKEIEAIDEARQSFEALKAATNALFDKQKARLDEQRLEINATMRDISQKEENIKAMLEENQKLLDLINGKKEDKIKETYAKMKDSAAAGIIEQLPLEEGAAVIFSLEAKKVSKIMAKMDPQKASDITQRLRVGPPFGESEANTTKE